jgi:hypothetical protein
MIWAALSSLAFLNIPRGLFREQVLDHNAVDAYGEQYQTKDEAGMKNL